MYNQRHLYTLLQGVEIWNEWYKNNYGLMPNLQKADLRDADLSGAVLTASNLREADLRGANLKGSFLMKADLRNALLDETNLSGAKLGWARLNDARLSKAILVDTDLRESSLTNARFIRADLSMANLMGSQLIAADLRGAKLDGTNLKNANLYNVNLSDASINETSFQGANLDGVKLSGTQIKRAYVGRTIFANIDSREVSGLENIRHTSPSTIGTDTLYKSNGEFPEVFLKGCGMPDTLIEYAHSFTRTAIEYYSCFISYSTQDDDFAQRIHNDLQAAGVRCWFAPHDIQGGKKVFEQIEGAIRVYDKLLLILSEDSMQSNWVKTEIIRAKKKEDFHGKQMFFPISIVPFEHITNWELIHSDSGRDLAEEIREYFIPDFSHWGSDPDAYKKSLDRLLRDLKAEPSA